MANLSKLDFQGKYNHSGTGLFKDNTSNDIEAVDVRALVTDTGDSFINRTDDVVDEDDMASNSAAKVPTQQSVKAYVDATGTTREFNRTWSSELLFDKNEIEYAEHTLTEDLEFTVAGSGHLTNQFSSAVQRVVTDGTHAVSFTGYNFVLGDIQSGSVPDAGTYLVLFLYWNGVATVNWTQPSLEVANLTPLAAPGSFAGAPDGDNEIDLSWSAVTGASSYEIYFSTTGGGGPWTSLTNPASGDTSYSHTGLSAGTTYHYRIRAIGDLVTFANSAYSVTAATTTDSGDSTPPVFTFDPEDAETDIPVNAIVTITANEAIQNADTTEITNANVDDVVVAREDTSGGSDIAFTGSIDAGKTVITLAPTLIWGGNQDVYIEIDGVEDTNTNELASPASATFTTGTYTEMNSNRLEFASSLNSYITGNDKKFEIEVTFRNSPTTGQRTFSSKWMDTGNQRSYAFTSNGTNMSFKFYQDGTDVHHTREIIWTNVLTDSNEHTVRLVYDGTIDTNNGLDRLSLYIDGVLQGSKSLLAFDDMITGSVWPFGIYAGTAPVKFFRISAQMKDLVFRADTGSGMVDIVDIPIIRTGEDTSGNNIDGTWV